MTAITPTYSRTYQASCLAGRPFVSPIKNVCLLHCQRQLSVSLPNSRTTTHERGNDFQGLAFHTGGTRSDDGETWAGWGAVARSIDGGIYVMFGLAVTTEAPFANAGARIHSNNTAELSSIVGALSVLRPWRSCPWFTIMHFSDSKCAAGVCLGTVQSRANVHLGLACWRLLLQIQLKLRFTMQHIYSQA